jgi:hypothetical protein
MTLSGPAVVAWAFPADPLMGWGLALLAGRGLSMPSANAGEVSRDVRRDVPEMAGSLWLSANVALDVSPRAPSPTSREGRGEKRDDSGCFAMTASALDVKNDSLSGETSSARIGCEWHFAL